MSEQQNRVKAFRDEWTQLVNTFAAARSSVAQEFVERLLSAWTEEQVTEQLLDEGARWRFAKVLASSEAREIATDLRRLAKIDQDLASAHETVDVWSATLIRAAELLDGLSGAGTVEPSEAMLDAFIAAHQPQELPFSRERLRWCLRAALASSSPTGSEPK